MRIFLMSLILIALTTLTSAVEGSQDLGEVLPGAPIERELSGDEIHAYHVTLVSGQYLQMAVAQISINVVVLLYDPDGKKLVEIDSPQSTLPEAVMVIAEATGKYRLEVRSLQKGA